MTSAHAVVHPSFLTRARRPAAWALLGLLLAAGCGPSAPPVALHEVRGRVAFGRQTPVGAQVVLHPRDGAWPHGSLPSATVAEDGSFRLGTFAAGDGAPAGEYVATVQWFPVDKDGSVGGNALPGKYAAPHSSPLTVTVQAGANDLPPLEITK